LCELNDFIDLIKLVSIMPGPTSEQVQSLVLNTLDAIPSGSKLDSRDLTLKLEDGSEVAFNEGDNQVLLKGVLDSLFSREVSRVVHTVLAEEASLP
jgi:hypothetical protein